MTIAVVFGLATAEPFRTSRRVSTAPEKVDVPVG